MLRKVVLIFLILIALWYGAGLLNMPFVLVALSVVIFYSFLYAVGTGVIWRILPKDRREILKKRRVYLHFIFLGYILLLLLGLRMISKYYMPGMPRAVRMMSLNS